MYIRNSTSVQTDTRSRKDIRRLTLNINKDVHTYHWAWRAMINLGASDYSDYFDYLSTKIMRISNVWISWWNWYTEKNWEKLQKTDSLHSCWAGELLFWETDCMQNCWSEKLTDCWSENVWSQTIRFFQFFSALLIFSQFHSKTHLSKHA